MNLLGFEKHGWSIREPLPMKSTLLFWGNYVVFKIRKGQLTKEYIIPGFVYLKRDKIEGISLAFRGYYLIKNNHWLLFIIMSWANNGRSNLTASGKSGA